MSRCFSFGDSKLEMHQSWLVNPIPPSTYPPSERRSCLGMINPLVSLNKALLNPYFQRGGSLVGGLLISHEPVT